MSRLTINGLNVEVSSFERSVGPDAAPANVTQTQMMLGIPKREEVPLASIAPMARFDVDNPSIPVVDMAQMLGNRMQAQNSNGRGGAHEIGFQMGSPVNLQIDYKKAKIKISKEQRRKFERSYSAVSLDILLARVAYHLWRNEGCAEMLDVAWKTGVWTTEYASGAVPKWNTSSADVLAQVNTARDAVGNACGTEPNHLALPRLVADALVINPRIRREMKGGTGADGTDKQVSYEDLRAYLKVEKLTVLNRRRNTASDLSGTASYAAEVTDGVLFFVDDGGGETNASAFVNAYVDEYIDGAQGVSIVTGVNDEDGYEWWNLRKQSKVQVLRAGAAAYWADVL